MACFWPNSICHHYCHWVQKHQLPIKFQVVNTSAIFNVSSSFIYSNTNFVKELLSVSSLQCHEAFTLSLSLSLSHFILSRWSDQVNSRRKLRMREETKDKSFFHTVLPHVIIHIPKSYRETEIEMMQTQTQNRRTMGLKKKCVCVCMCDIMDWIMGTCKSGNLAIPSLSSFLCFQCCIYVRSDFVLTRLEIRSRKDHKQNWEREREKTKHLHWQWFYDIYINEFFKPNRKICEVRKIRGKQIIIF